MKLSVPTRLAAPMLLHAQTASDLMMPNPVSIRSSAAVAEVISLFTEKGITAAPVIDEAGRPIGVVSQSDLLIHQSQHARKKAGEPGYFMAPTFKSADSAGETKIDSRSSVADVMTPAIFAVSPDTPVARVVSEMVGLHVHRLFVVDPAGVLVGVVTTMDVLKHLQPNE